MRTIKMTKTQSLSPELLQKIVTDAAHIKTGKTANYIPELAKVNPDITGIIVQRIGSEPVSHINIPCAPVTLQSTAKLIPMIGILEELGLEFLLNWVMLEPSGDDFASITRLAQYGPMPSNPMLNSGAITLCSHIPGTGEAKFAWLDKWIQKLFNQRLTINATVFASEKRTGDKNRALAYLLKSRGMLGTDLLDALDLYFALCSYEGTLDQLIYLPLLLANGGCDPVTQERIISEKTTKTALAVMATCGLYDETGTHMVKTGMPSKSGVSGYILAVVPGKAGIVTLSPLVNPKGNSIRGQAMLEALSSAMNWHFAIP